STLRGAFYFEVDRQCQAGLLALATAATEAARFLVPLGSSIPVARTKNPSTLSADFLFKPIGLVYHHAIACISLPHLCGVYHHTIGVHISIGLMRYSGFATDDMQN
ncbi:MAG: hypothetical protein IJN42_07535, partial [Clostridia bacterium]|nr:hypothetical protein [Clostridia bacterium]